MGQIFQGILGGFSGKVGTVIGYVRNGVSFMRGLSTGHTDANTPAQQEQRAKFSLVVNFLRPLAALLHTGFKTAESRMSGFNAAMSYNMEHAVKGLYPLLEIDYTKALVCRGLLPGALNAAADSVEAGKIDFTWNNNAWDAGADPLDKVVLVAYNAGLQKSVTEIGVATRASGSQSMTVPDIFTGDEVHCYIGFTNARGTEFSNCEFLSTVIVA
ncbi:MAG: DUF6266 family protein [Methylococcaceae bacterium]|nr:DUF6266 family protein [Prolixibacteraceae bacterium]